MLCHCTFSPRLSFLTNYLRFPPPALQVFCSASYLSFLVWFPHTAETFVFHLSPPLETGVRTGLTCCSSLKMLPSIPSTPTSGFPSVAPLPSETQGAENICPSIMSPAQASSPRPYEEKFKEGVGEDLTSGSKPPKRKFGKGENSDLSWTILDTYPFTFQMNHDVGLPYTHLLKLAFLKLLPTFQMSNRMAF